MLTAPISSSTFSASALLLNPETLTLKVVEGFSGERAVSWWERLI